MDHNVCQKRAEVTMSESQSSPFWGFSARRRRCQLCLVLHLLSATLSLYAMYQVANLFPAALLMASQSKDAINLLPFSMSLVSMVIIAAPTSSVKSLAEIVKELKKK